MSRRHYTQAEEIARASKCIADAKRFLGYAENLHPPGEGSTCAREARLLLLEEDRLIALAVRGAKRDVEARRASKREAA